MRVDVGYVYGVGNNCFHQYSSVVPYDGTILVREARKVKEVGIPVKLMEITYEVSPVPGLRGVLEEGEAKFTVKGTREEIRSAVSQSFPNDWEVWREFIANSLFEKGEFDVSSAWLSPCFKWQEIFRPFRTRHTDRDRTPPRGAGE